MMMMKYPKYWEIIQQSPRGTTVDIKTPRIKTHILVVEVVTMDELVTMDTGGGG